MDSLKPPGGMGSLWTKTSYLARMAAATGTTIEELTGRGQGRRMAFVRFACFLQLRRLKGFSLPQIGAIFNRDHTTVLHGIRRAEKMEKASASFRALMEDVKP